jgi:crotonobetaine/carnitine-CoA ligase
MGYVRAGETILVNLPLFHVSGIAGVYAALVHGGTVAIVNAFSPTRFWPQVRHFDAVTSCGIVGSMGPLLIKQPPTPDDRNHHYRFVVIAPLLESGLAIAERHGFGFYSSFGMTEVPLPLVSDPGDKRLGSCGRPRSGVQARVVDANDIEVPDGSVGELILRADLPWAFMHGYHGMPEATAAAWRNGWFHTGDAFRREADGTFYFVDRIKDAIRRRGENVSSSEVEAEIVAHHAIRDCAVVAVPSEHGEDEIMAVIEPREDAVIDPVELTAFLTPRLAYFMVPRFIRVVPALPRTHSLRVQKNLLRADGVTSDTWDREVAGLELTRPKFR